jgi:hypothetical protein
MTECNFLDRFNDKIYIGSKFILYRNRSIPYSEIKEMRVKNNRFMMNHFNTNQSSPRMCIMFEDKNKAELFHDAIINKVYF